MPDLTRQAMTRAIARDVATYGHPSTLRDYNLRQIRLAKVLALYVRANDWRTVLTRLAPIWGARVPKSFARS